MKIRPRHIATACSATVIGLALALPAAAQQRSFRDIPGTITNANSMNWENFESSAAAGAGTRQAMAGTAADINPSTHPVVRHQGANPANILCDGLQPESLAREDRGRGLDALENCLAANTAGGGLQQGGGDGN